MQPAVVFRQLCEAMDDEPVQSCSLHRTTLARCSCSLTTLSQKLSLSLSLSFSHTLIRIFLLLFLFFLKRPRVCPLVSLGFEAIHARSFVRLCRDRERQRLQQHSLSCRESLLKSPFVFSSTSSVCCHCALDLSQSTKKVTGFSQSHHEVDICLGRPPRPGWLSPC